MLLDPLRRMLHTSGMTYTQQLIARIEALAEKQGKAPATVAAPILGSGQAFANLKEGKTITLAKFERAWAALAEMERAA
jgi:hypothetical protein